MFLLFLLAVIVTLVTINNSNIAKQFLGKSQILYKREHDAAQAPYSSSQETEQLTRMVAHDLKNPVHAISTITSMLLDNPSLSRDDQEMIGLIKLSSFNLTAVIDSLLINNRNGSFTLNMQSVNITQLMRRSIALLQFKASEKEQVIVLNAPTDFLIPADSDQLWRVFNNILVNAIKFSQEHTTINVTIEQFETAVQIAVTDEGIGIPDHIGNAVFYNNVKARRLGTFGEETYGMGLSLSKQIVNAHNGQIWYDHAPVKGTTFYIRLPMANEPVLK